jgi:hypothetical protein
VFVAAVAQPGRSGREERDHPLSMLEHHPSCPGLGAGRMHAGAVRRRARSARPGHGPVGMHPWLGCSLNAVKRYVRAQKADDLLRSPHYSTCLVDAHRVLVRQRLAEIISVIRILAEIREHGYTGSVNLLVRYISQDQPATRHALATQPLLDHEQAGFDSYLNKRKADGKGRCGSLARESYLLSDHTA